MGIHLRLVFFHTTTTKQIKTRCESLRATKTIISFADAKNIQRNKGTFREISIFQCTDLNIIKSNKVFRCSWLRSWKINKVWPQKKLNSILIINVRLGEVNLIDWTIFTEIDSITRGRNHILMANESSSHWNGKVDTPTNERIIPMMEAWKGSAFLLWYQFQVANISWKRNKLNVFSIYRGHLLYSLNGLLRE